MSKDHDDTWWLFTPPLGRFCLLKNKPTHLFFELISFCWRKCVSLKKKGVIAASLGRERFQSVTLAMTGIMLTLVWSPSMTSISRGLFASNYIFMIWRATPNCTKDTIMTSISRGLFASNCDVKSWHQIVLQGKNVRLNWFAKLIDPRLNRGITGKSEQPAVYPNWQVRCI